MCRRAHDSDAGDGKHGLRDGGQPRGRGERLPVYRGELDRRSLGNDPARAGAEAEQTLFADIDPVRSRTKHLVRVPGRHEVNRIADRRPGFYGPLVAPNGKG